MVQKSFPQTLVRISRAAITVFLVFGAIVFMHVLMKYLSDQDHIGPCVEIVKSQKEYCSKLCNGLLSFHLGDPDSHKCHSLSCNCRE